MTFHTKESIDSIQQMRNLAGGNLPLQEAVHQATMRYIRNDYEKNGHKYSLVDKERIQALLAVD